jgi:hypothetical protein
MLCRIVKWWNSEESIEGKKNKIKGQSIPGNFFGFLKGTNFAPIARAMGGPKINPRASIPE